MSRYMNRDSFTTFDCQAKIEAIRMTVDDAFDKALKDDNYDDWQCVYEALALLAGTLRREGSRVANYAGKAVIKNR